MGDLTLAEFLAARLGEDEAGSCEVHEARVCSGCSDGWEAGFDPDRCDCGYPARVLREAGAGRKILALHHIELIEVINADGDERSGYSCAECDVQEYPCATLRLLAAVHADHPDYREEWRP